MEMGSNEAIKHAVVAGLGVSVISLHTITLEGPKGPVAIVDVEQFPIMKQWFIAYPKSKDLSLVAKTFLDYAINYEASMRKALMHAWPMGVRRVSWINLWKSNNHLRVGEFFLPYDELIDCC